MKDPKQQIEQERKEKDEFFGRHPQSPIPFEKGKEFDGLNYYPVDPELRFRLKLHEHEDKEEIKVEDNKGNKKVYIRWGELRFKVNGKQVTLQAYKNEEREEKWTLAGERDLEKDAGWQRREKTRKIKKCNDSLVG